MSNPRPGQNLVVQAEVDAELLRRATEALSGQGLSVSRAIQLMLKYVAREGELPLDLMETKAATEEVERGDLAGFATVQGLRADLSARDYPEEKLAFEQSFKGTERTITAEGFDWLADSGEDISAYLDWGKEWR
jgi:addiction module RelB/DinJ family antitoxin